MTEDKKNDNSNVKKFPLTPRERQRLYQKKLLEDKPIYLQEPANEQPEPMFNIPKATKNISILLIIIYVAMFFLPTDIKTKFFYSIAFIPARYSGGLAFDICAIISPVTYMLLHGGLMHLLVNVGMLLACGSNIEKIFGAKKMLILFALSGVAGAFTHFLIYPSSMNSLIGASAGVSGLFAAICVMMSDGGRNKRQLLTLVAIWVGIFLLFGAIGAPATDTKVGWVAHLGGFFFGLALMLKWLKNRY